MQQKSQIARSFSTCGATEESGSGTTYARLTASNGYIPDAMLKGTLTSVTDGSYIKQLAPNICGAGWIVQDKLTGKKVKG